MVEVNNIKEALTKLQEDNWLYTEVDVSSINKTLKQVIDVVLKTLSTMIKKVTDSVVAGFQFYTIRNLDNKLSTETDIKQCKLLYIQENTLNNQQKYQDVMYSPVLFADDNFGKYHLREVKLSHSKYIKSHLLNKDSRFRKDPQ